MLFSMLITVPRVSQSSPGPPWPQETSSSLLALWLAATDWSFLFETKLSYTCLFYSVRPVSASLLTFGYTHHHPISWTSGNCPANQNYGHQTWRRSYGRGRRRMWEAEQGGRSGGSRGAVGGDPPAPFPGATQAGFISCLQASFHLYKGVSGPQWPK